MTLCFTADILTKSSSVRLLFTISHREVRSDHAVRAVTACAREVWQHRTLSRSDVTPSNFLAFLVWFHVSLTLFCSSVVTDQLNQQSWSGGAVLKVTLDIVTLQPTDHQMRRYRLLCTVTLRTPTFTKSWLGETERQPQKVLNTSAAKTSVSF